MLLIQKVIYTGFAMTAIASASLPALSWTPAPHQVDFEWYANAGRPLAPAQLAEPTPAPRAGYIWVPGRYELRGDRQVWTQGVWIQDDYERQWTAYANGHGGTTYTTGPLVLRDRSGNVIPTDPAAYPVDPARR
jgi:hypothetical protein